uniref:Uncharacterized protein n=2 Tax=Oryza sativa subsp. japonica TaxID=39947 RepID=Q69VA7_ORYSJ|nr:hypothetical protein [Oryza sativa Japonica Group]BAD30526.1 hypothetical protein [Oryza sativa Japonica Group]
MATARGRAVCGVGDGKLLRGFVVAEQEEENPVAAGGAPTRWRPSRRRGGTRPEADVEAAACGPGRRRGSRGGAEATCGGERGTHQRGGGRGGRGRRGAPRCRTSPTLARRPPVQLDLCPCGRHLDAAHRRPSRAARSASTRADPCAVRAETVRPPTRHRPSPALARRPSARPRLRSVDARERERGRGEEEKDDMIEYERGEIRSTVIVQGFVPFPQNNIEST